MWNCTHENARVKERKRIKTTDDDVARNNDVYKMCCRCKPNTTCALFRHFTISYAVRYFRWKIIILARCDKHSLAITTEQIVMNCVRNFWGKHKRKHICFAFKYFNWYVFMEKREHLPKPSKIMIWTENSTANIRFSQW